MARIGHDALNSAAVRLAAVSSDATLDSRSLAVSIAIGAMFVRVFFENFQRQTPRGQRGTP
jgi:hypothetical protein